MPEKTLLRKRNQQLLQLACSEAMHSGNFHKFLHEVVQISSETLDVERVGVWFYNSDHSKIFCECLYERGTGKFTKGFDLSARQYPQYFKALAERRAIVADDAQHDKDTQEFTENYLKKFDIRSMLDAPIRRTRGVVGIVCHEHIGSARHWTAEEEQFAATISDFITMALQERERKTAPVSGWITQVAKKLLPAAIKPVPSCECQPRDSDKTVGDRPDFA